MMRIDEKVPATLLHLAALCVVCALAFFLFLGRNPLHDKGEPREALVVRDIVVNGNWVFPLKLGQQIPSKPPLFHWFAAMSSLVRGEMTEATLRFPSALFGGLGALLCYFLGRRLYDSRTGMYAGLILATTTIYYSMAVEARVDMTLTFFLTLSLTLFYSLYRGFLRHQLWWYLFFIIVGLSVTAKGPVSVILCGLVVVIFLGLRRDWPFMLRLLRHPGVVIGIIVCSGWYVAAVSLGGSEFFGLQFVKENFARFFIHGEGGTGHQKPFGYFLPYLFGLGMPWTLFLPAVVWWFFKNRCFRCDELLFFGLWAAVIFLFFSLSAGKRPPYILPVYPPLALLLAAWLCSDALNGVENLRYFKILSAVACLIVLALATLVAVQVTGAEPVTALQLIGIRLKPDSTDEIVRILAAFSSAPWLVSGFLFASAGLWLVIAFDFLRGNVQQAVNQLVLASVLGVVFAHGFVVPELARAESYKDFVQSSLKQIPHDRALWMYPQGIDYSSIIFYGRGRVEILPEDEAALHHRLEQSTDYCLIEEVLWRSAVARSASSNPVILRSTGAGPDRDAHLVLVQGWGG